MNYKMNQLSLFDLPSMDFYERIQDLLNSLIAEYELPSHSLHLFSNVSSKGANKGMEISKSVCIYEPEFPIIKEDIDNPGKNMVVLNIKLKNGIELLVRNFQFECIPVPESAKLKILKDTVFKHIVFSTNDISVFDYIRENILWCLKNYRSKEKSFGCCSQFMRCSDEKRCVHQNKLYSTACMYRRNLEAGKIFFGKNRNI